MKIVIIGFGSIAQKHVQAAKTLDENAEIYALRSGSPDSSGIFPGIRNIFHFSEIPADIDFIIISNITSLHADAIIKSLPLHVPLMIEKPLVHSVSQLNEVLASIEQNGSITYTACNLRFHPALVFVKQYLSETDVRVNEVNIYCGSFLPEWRKGQAYEQSYSADPLRGGGVHLDLIHELDYCVWLFGLPAKTDVIKRNVSTLEIASIDYANFRLVYDTFVASVTLNYFRKDTKRSMEILFADATWTVDLINCRISDHEHNLIFETEFNMADTYVSQMKYFTDAIRNGAPPMNSVKEASEIMKICLTNE